jgi:hypothetical protein
MFVAGCGEQSSFIKPWRKEMATIFTNFKHIGHAAVLALALGTACLSAAPVQAQEPSVNFQIELGNGGSDQGPQLRRGGPRRDDFRACLSDRQIRRGLTDYGFRNVDLRRELGRNRVEARGDYRRWTYSMRVNRCTGRVDRVERLRPNLPGGGGFGLQFNFGN